MKKTNKPKGQTAFKKNCAKRVVHNYTVMVDGKPKRKQKTFYGATLKEAEKKREEYLRLKNKGIYAEDAKMLLCDYVKKWLSLKTKNMNVNNARAKNVIHYLGSMPIGDIKRSDIQLMINQFSSTNTNRGKLPGRKSVESLRYVTNQIFESAVLDKIIEVNPCQKITIPTYEKTKVLPLTSEEIDRVLHFPHKWQHLMVVLLCTGLRRSELIPLKWKDYDSKNSCITVNKTINFVNNRPVLKPYGKTATSNRKVYLTDNFCSYMDDYYFKLVENLIKESGYTSKQAEQFLQEQYVCPALNFDMFTETQWTNMLNNYHTDYEYTFGNPMNYHRNDKRFKLTLPVINPHRMRHTFCCSMFYAGISVNIAQRQMGHANASTTLNIYAQCEEESRIKKEINEKMNKKDTVSPEMRLLEAIMTGGEFPMDLLK